jgi:hypothetical protein
MQQWMSQKTQFASHNRQKNVLSQEGQMQHQFPESQTQVIVEDVEEQKKNNRYLAASPRGTLEAQTLLCKSHARCSVCHTFALNL